MLAESSCGKTCWKNHSPVKNWKYGSWTQRSHSPSSDSPQNVLSKNSPIMERVSIRGGRPRFRGRCGLAVDSVPIEPAGKQNQFVLHETAKTLCNYPTGTDGFLAGVLRGTLPRR